MTNSSSAKSGALSIEQAAALMGKKPKREDACACEEPEAEEDEQDSPVMPMAGDADGAETRTEGDDDEARSEDGPEDEESEQGSLKPPRFWDAEAKKRFGELPRDVQEIIVAKEDARNAATSRALQETAEKRKALDAEGARLGQLINELDRLVPQASAAFQQRWRNTDWSKLVAETAYPDLHDALSAWSDAAQPFQKQPAARGWT